MNIISEKCSEYGNKIKEFFSGDAKIILFLSMIAGFVCHFYFFTHEAMAPDAVYYSSLSIAGDWEASLGRWGIRIITLIRGGMVNSFLITVFSILCIALSVLLLVRIFEIKSKAVSILLAVVMMTAPQMAETLLFTYTADAYFFAVLLSCFAVYCISAKKCSLWKYLIAGSCIVFSLGIYQTYIGVVIGIVITSFIKKLLEEEDTKKSIKWFIKNIIFIFICLVLYFLVTKLYLHLKGLELASYRGANSFGLDTILQMPSSMVRVYKEFVEFLFGEGVINNSFWKRNIINGCITIILFVSLVYHIIKRNIYKKPIRLLALLLAFLVFPVAVNVIGIIMPGNGINLVIGYAEILYYVLFLVVIEKGLNSLRVPSLGVVAILCITFLFSNNATYMARYDVFRNYYAESSRILTKVEMLEGYSTDLPWMFSDNIQYRSDYSELGNGFISDDLMTWRVATGIWLNRPFYKKYFGKEINMVSYEQHNEILNSEEFKNMGIYPEENSIQIIDDVIVIKLSESGSYVQ